MKARLLISVAVGIGLVFSLLVILQQSVQGAIATAPSTVHCVNTDGSGGCYTSIQSAIDAASPTGGDVIIVDTGVYTEHIYVDKNLELFGRGWMSTTIDGGYTGPTPTLRIKWGIEPSTIISGFKIIGGGTGISSTSTQDGGGIYMYSASPHIINTWVDGCTARNGGGVFVNGGLPFFENVPVWNSKAFQRGGGYYIENEAHATILANFIGTNGTVWFNRAAWDGGGMYINRSEATVIGMRFWWNVSEMYGGGIYIASTPITLPVRLYGNQIWLNGAKTTGYAGGGLYAYNAKNLDIFDNDISFNISPGTGGGALFNQSGGLLHWNRINNNRVSGQNAYSAGAHVDGASDPNLTVVHNWFKGNISTHGAGALGISYGAAPMIDSNVIVSNSIGSGTGSGIHIQDAGEAHLINNIIARNVITDYGDRGSGISIFNSPIHFINNTVADNLDGGIYLVNAENAVVVNNIIAQNTNCGLEASATITYTILTDYNDLFNNTTNYCLVTAGSHDSTTANPKFLMTGDEFNYYHVEPDSHVEDLGDPFWAPMYDIDGLFRGSKIWLGVDEDEILYNLFVPMVLR